jgi:tRNA threonylcarbamoyladenosine biosynthesis protein TsaE
MGQRSFYFEYSLDEVPEIARKLLENSGTAKCWCFHGEMGAGKTTLISEICRQLGVKDEISSPTYAIVKEYLGTQGPVFHLDAFRIKDEEEAFEAGLDEIVNGPDHCFIEWPENIEQLLPNTYFYIEIQSQGNIRLLSARHHE